MPEVELPNPEELEELKAKAFTRRVAFTTALFAVLLAISALGGSNAMKEMLLAQQQSSDQWAFYQAKVVREHFYRGQKMRLELDLLERDSVKPDIRQKYDDLIKKMAAEEKRYAAEKKEIEQEARKLEKERDINRDKDPYFDYAEVLLQIAIVLSSMAILAHSRLVFLLAIFSATLGSILGVNGFLMLFHLPFFHH